MRCRCAMSILLATVAILVAASPVQAAIAAVTATREVASEEWAGGAFPPRRPPSDERPLPPPARASSGEPPAPPSSEPGVGNPQRSKAAQAPEPKQETPVQPGSAGAQGGANSTVSKPRHITFTPGFRFQARSAYDRESGRQDFFIARLRLKAKGELFRVVRYGFEFKIDNLARSGKDPKGQLENAWLEFPVTPALAFRVGLYDLPFSRNALTSDSKLLLMDRSLIKDQLTSFGLADNTVGVLGHGRPYGGRFEYSVGLFNNEQFRRFEAPGAKRSDHLMPAGRIAFHFLDRAAPGGYADYQSSYVGKGKKLSIGANTAYLGSARDGVNKFDLSSWGTDLFFSTGPFALEAEYDGFKKEMTGGNPDIRGDGWYAQAGYLVRRRVEFTARHQNLDPDVRIPGNGLRWTSVGSNIYIRGHNLKMQFEYTFRRGPGQVVKTDVLQIQMQADF